MNSEQNNSSPSVEQWISEVADQPLARRFADIADRYIGTQGQGYFSQQIDDYRLEMAWDETEQGIDCQAEVFGPGDYQSKGRKLVASDGCRDELEALIAEQLPNE